MNGNADLVFISYHFQNNKARRRQGNSGKKARRRQRNSGKGKKARPGDKLPSALTGRNLFCCLLCASKEILYDSCCL